MMKGAQAVAAAQQAAIAEYLKQVQSAVDQAKGLSSPLAQYWAQQAELHLGFIKPNSLPSTVNFHGRKALVCAANAMLAQDGRKPNGTFIR